MNVRALVAQRGPWPRRRGTVDPEPLQEEKAWELLQGCFGFRSRRAKGCLRP